MQTPTVKQSIIRMIREAFPQLYYGIPRSYVVHAVRGDKRLDLDSPPDISPPYPTLQAVPQAWAPGMLATPQVGARVTVVFRDADPSRPIVIAIDADTPIDLAIDASGVLTIGASASEVDIAGGSVVVAAGQEIGRPVRWGDTGTHGAVSGTFSPTIPGITPVSKVKT